MNDFSNPGAPRDPGFHKPRSRQCNPLFSANLVFGVLFIVAGAALMLDRLGYMNAREFFYYWPVVLVIFGVGLLARRGRQAAISGSLLTVAGSVLLLQRLGILNIGLRELWPLVLIAIGIVVLYNSLRSRTGEVPAGSSGNPDVLNDGAFFGGVEKKVQSERFQGGEVFAVFGGVELNLRQARIPKGQRAVVNANAIFGGVEMTVPETWHVVTEGVAILGGFADSRKYVDPRDETEVDDQPTLVVRGLAMFGGVEIKN